MIVVAVVVAHSRAQPIPLRRSQPALRNPHSALNTRHSALRTPHSVLRTPSSAIRTPHGAVGSPHPAIPSILDIKTTGKMIKYEAENVWDTMKIKMIW